MVPQGRKDRGLAQQILFDIEKRRPERTVVSVGDQIAGLQDKIRYTVRQNATDDTLVDSGPCPVIAVSHKVEWSLTSCGCPEAS
jgi:hypothetical protein